MHTFAVCSLSCPNPISALVQGPFQTGAFRAAATPIAWTAGTFAKYRAGVTQAEACKRCATLWNHRQTTREGESKITVVQWSFVRRCGWVPHSSRRDLVLAHGICSGNIRPTAVSVRA